MSQHNQFDLIEAEAIRPDLSSYQNRIVGQSSEALVDREKDVLIEAPTGAGKTAMLAVLANSVAEQRENGKVLILTHRRNLFRQMAGDPGHTNLKKRVGEMAFWSGKSAGTIAENKLGGINQEADVVLAMVETAANLSDLAEYTDIFIDETHHASEASSDREDIGSYAKIIDRCPNAKITGVTATSFRGDDGRLHPRLEAAERFIVGIEETQNEGRTVRAKTYVSKARLENGMTPTELYRAEQEGKLEKSASATMKGAKGDAYYAKCLDEWKAISGRTSTIVFTDSVDEIDKVHSLMNETFGDRTAVMIHGGRTDEQNNQAMKSFEQGEADVLVSCQMIGEGFDIPDTANVMSFNSSITRGNMNQFVGRCVRSADGKEYGNFIDCGTGTARHGLVEDQHKLQTVRALAFSGSKKDAVMAIARSTADRDGDWSVVPGEDRTLFFRREEGSKFQGYSVDKNLMSQEGRRVTSGTDAGRAFRRLTDRDGLSLISLSKMAGIIGEHVQSEAGFIARSGGLRGEEYKKIGGSELSAWNKELSELSKHDAVNTATQEREARVRAAVRGDRRSQVGFKAVLKALNSGPNKVQVLKETVRLSGCVLDEISKSDSTPLGMKDEMAEMGARLRDGAKRKMNSKELVAFASSAEPALMTVAHLGLPKSVSETSIAIGTLVKTAKSSMLGEKDLGRQ